MLLAFVVCHLTHESAATLLPMMGLVGSHVCGIGKRARASQNRDRALAALFALAVILAGFLAIAYEVNTRSYLVREGHYAFGWHAVANILNYVIWLYVGQRAWLDYAATLAVLGAVLVWGTLRMRFAVA